MIVATHGILANSNGNSLNTGLRNVWNFDNVATDSVGGLTATLQNGLTYTSSGIINQSLTFDGNDYATLTDNSMNLTGDFTISLWVYPTSGAAQTLFNNRGFISGTVNKGWGLHINNITGGQTSKVTWIQPFGPASTQYTGWEYRTTSLTLNAWNHIIITRESGVNTHCWVNNIFQTLTTVSGTGNNVALDPVYHTTQKVSVGAYVSLAGVASSYVVAGTRIDALTIWNRQLTTIERADLYNSGTGKQYLYV